MSFTFLFMYLLPMYYYNRYTINTIMLVYLLYYAICISQMVMFKTFTQFIFLRKYKLNKEIIIDVKPVKCGIIKIEQC